MKCTFTDTVDWIKDSFDLSIQNHKIKRSKKQIEDKYEQVVEQINDLNKKYIDLLEKKSEQFDLYVDYQKQCMDLSTDKRELKKKLAISKETIMSLEEKINKIEKKKGNKNGKNEIVQSSK